MGNLFLVSTPIGNLEDISIRALKTIFSVDILLCEDTRRGGLLVEELKKRYAEIIRNVNHTPRLISYYDQIEFQKIPEIIEYLKNDQNIALISDAGTPLISDPGFKLVFEARKRNIGIISIPGPSAVLSALISSGLPPNQFTFLGYFSDSQKKRIDILKALLDSNKILSSTYIFYSAPHKLNQTLADIKNTLGDIHITIARELTKIHEEIWSGTVSEALNHFSTPLGEFVLLFHL